MRRGHLLGNAAPTAGGREITAPGRQNSEGQHIVEELGRSDEDAVSGRHRAPASVRRRVAVGLGVAAFAVVAAIGLGLTTADALGLSETEQAEQGAVREILPSRQEEPRAGRTIDLTDRPAVPPAAPEADAAPADPSPEPPAHAAAATPADEPAPAAGAARAASPAPVRTVRTGDSCPAVGRTGVTSKGNAAVCTASPGNGPNKWRVA
jgi:hypothetical protein